MKNHSCSSPPSRSKDQISMSFAIVVDLRSCPSSTATHASISLPLGINETGAGEKMDLKLRTQSRAWLMDALISCVRVCLDLFTCNIVCVALTDHGITQFGPWKANKTSLDEIAFQLSQFDRTVGKDDAEEDAWDAHDAGVVSKAINKAVDSITSIPSNETSKVWGNGKLVHLLCLLSSNGHSHGVDESLHMHMHFPNAVSKGFVVEIDHVNLLQNKNQAQEPTQVQMCTHDSYSYNASGEIDRSHVGISLPSDSPAFEGFKHFVLLDVVCNRWNVMCSCINNIPMRGKGPPSAASAASSTPSSSSLNGKKSVTANSNNVNKKLFSVKVLHQRHSIDGSGEEEEREDREGNIRNLEWRGQLKEPLSMECTCIHRLTLLTPSSPAARSMIGFLMQEQTQTQQGAIRAVKLSHGSDTSHVSHVVMAHSEFELFIHCVTRHTPPTSVSTTTAVAVAAPMTLKAITSRSQPASAMSNPKVFREIAWQANSAEWALYPRYGHSEAQRARRVKQKR